MMTPMNPLKVISILLIAYWYGTTALAAPFEETGKRITGLNVMVTNQDTYLEDAATVFVQFEGQSTLEWYSFTLSQSSPISAAIYNGLLSSFATGASVTLSGEELTCGCNGCPREITGITLD